MTGELIIYVHEWRDGGKLHEIERITRPLATSNPMWSLHPKYEGRKVFSLHVSDVGVHIYFEERPASEQVVLQEPAPPPVTNSTDLYDSSKGSSF